MPHVDRPAEHLVTHPGGRGLSGNVSSGVAIVMDGSGWRGLGDPARPEDLSEQATHRPARRTWSRREVRASPRKVVKRSACSLRTLVRIDRATAIRSAICELTNE